MTATKSASLESKQFFDERKEMAKQELHKISTKEDIFDKQKKVLTNLFLDEVKEKQGTGEFKNHAEIRKADYKKIRELVIERVGDPKKITKEDIQDAVDFFYGKSDMKESKETFTKSLEFEEDTFKIDSTWWKETKKDAYNWKPIKVKENATGDVVEYLEWPAKWEQIFITYAAFIREVCKAKNCSKEEAKKKYLMTIVELKEKMKDKPDGSEEYKKFFNKEVKDHFAGYWNPSGKRFSNVGGWSSVWLADGDAAGFGQDGWVWGLINRRCGFSGRLLKN